MLSFFSISASRTHQEIEAYEHFWRGTISLLHLALLHVVLSATPNVITPNVMNLCFPAKSIYNSQFVDWGRGCGNGEDNTFNYLNAKLTENINTTKFKFHEIF